MLWIQSIIILVFILASIFTADRVKHLYMALRWYQSRIIIVNNRQHDNISPITHFISAIGKKSKKVTSYKKCACNRSNFESLPVTSNPTDDSVIIIILTKKSITFPPKSWPLVQSKWISCKQSPIIRKSN